MEKIVFKNFYVNILIGTALIVLSLLSYFLGWMEEFLPIVVAVILILLSTKRFIYSFKKIVSKNATLILVIEFILDLLFAGLLIALKDHVELFTGLILYIRGVSYLLINYIATRKIRLLQYVLNILYVTAGSFLMFYPTNYADYLVVAIVVVLLIVGAVFLQAGLVKLNQTEKLEEANEKKVKLESKINKEEERTQKIIEKKDKKIDELEDDLKQVKKKVETIVPEKKPEPKPEVSKTGLYDSMTVAGLKQLCRERNLTGYSQFTKKELIELLEKK